MYKRLSEMLDKITSWIDNNDRLLYSILLKLISFNTSNPPGDTREIVEYIAEYFHGLGLSIKYAARDPLKPNLIVSNKADGETLFLYNGHLDVVPVTSYNEWICDPFAGCIKDGFIYGRGSSDMKGSIAAMMIAVKALIEAEFNFNEKIELHLVSDEETGGLYGTKYLVDKGFVRAKYGLVGEASVLNDNVYIRPAVRGGAWIRLKSYGRAGHASNPKSGVNAVLNMARVLTYLNDNFKLGELHHHDILPSPTISVGTLISGGTKENIIPDYCEAVCDIRTIPGVSSNTVVEHVKDLVNELRKSYGNLNIKIELVREVKPAELSTDSRIIGITKKVVKILSGYDPEFLGGTGCNDATYLIKDAGVEAIPGFGPGDGLIGNIHGVNERVSMDILRQFAKYYAAILYELYRVE
jgi:acetylornithine deacetylase/succinyl-diaminopimelate desuccinylase family protein